MNQGSILYVEDDETLAFVTRDNLELKGYQVIHYSDGKKVNDDLSNLTFDLVIMDIMIPGLDGFYLAGKIRKQNPEVPILFLSAKSLKEDRLKGFGLGADDYITKPFSIEELIFRIQVFLKRKSVPKTPLYNHNLQLGHFLFDHQNLTLTYPNGKKELTQKEADLLQYLAIRMNQLCKRGEILEQIWGEDDYFLGRSLDVFISRLRRYLSSDGTIILENIHGVGFRLKNNEND